MTPQMLLQETERATGSADMLPRHLELIKLHQEYKILAQGSEANEKELERLKVLQERTREEVERFRQREELRERITYLENLRPAAQMQQYMDNAVAAKTEFRAAYEKLKKAKAQAEPSARLVEESKEKTREARERLQETGLVLQKAEKKFKKLFEKRHEFDAQVAEQNTAIQAIIRERENLRGEIRKLNRDIEKLEATLQHEPDATAERELNEQLKDIRARLRANETQREAAADKTSELDQQRSRLDGEIDGLKRELTKLDNADVQKLNLAKRADPNTYNAILWLRRNQDKFSEQIYEPPIMCMAVRDTSTDYAVESVVRRNSMLTFTCLNRADYVLFNKLVQDDLGFSVSVAEFSNSDHPTLDTWPRALSNERLQAFGFDCFVTDLISAPDAVVNMLCHVANIDQVAFSRRELTLEQINALDNEKRGNGEPLIAKYISGRRSVYVKRSSYGDREIMKSMQTIYDSMVLKGSGGDHQEKAELTEKVTDLVDQAAQTKDSHAASVNKLKLITRDRRALDEERSKIQGGLQEIQNARRAYNTAEARLNDCRVQLRELEARPNNFDERIAECREAIGEINQQKEAFATSLVNALQRIFDAKVENAAKAVEGFKHSSDYAVLKERFEIANQELVDLEKECAERKFYHIN